MAILVAGAVAGVVVQAESEPAPKALAEAAIAVVEFAAKAVISIA